MLPRSWNKSFNNGIIIPVKMRRGIECNSKILCTTCKNQVNETREFESNLNLIKRQPSNEIGHMPPYVFKIRWFFL